MEAGYKKRRLGTKKECKVFVIVCEGETERIYFNRFRKRKCGLIIKTPNTSSTDPINLVNFAKRQIERYDLNFKEGDKIWCVFDANGSTDQAISKAISLSRAEINIAISNPSFEIWYLLHFAYTNNRLDNQNLIDILKKYIKNYEKTEDYFDILKDKRENATKNTKKLNEHHLKNKRDIFSKKANPSTQVFRLVEDIIKIIGK